ncbi:MAG: hypothetical protein KH420_04240 [Clostridiales bacterium]|nr:hypothetical protein [Clostridiales bacterium]
MDEKLKSVLLKGETVKWTGRPEKSKLLEKPFGTRLYITWAIAAVVLIVSCVLLVPIAVNSDVYTVETIALIIAINFAPVMLSFQPIYDKSRLENSTLYAITDCRVLVLSKENVISLPIDEHIQIAVENRANGTGNVCFNDAIGKSIARSRTNSILGIKDMDGAKSVIGLVFYNVKNPDAVGGYLMRKAV